MKYWPSGRSARSAVLEAMPHSAGQGPLTAAESEMGQRWFDSKTVLLDEVIFTKAS